jgi:hypothetical protein
MSRGFLMFLNFFYFMKGMNDPRGEEMEGGSSQLTGFAASREL